MFDINKAKKLTYEYNGRHFREIEDMIDRRIELNASQGANMICVNEDDIRRVVPEELSEIAIVGYLKEIELLYGEKEGYIVDIHTIYDSAAVSPLHYALISWRSL